MIRFLLLLAVAICIPACTAIDQAANHAAPTAALPGSALALRSSGSASADGSWTLTSNGFVGTYLKLDAAGDVNVSVVASGTGAQKPHFNIVVDDDRGSFDATPSQTSYAHKFHLPPGTHFIRVEFTSCRDHSDQSLTIHSLTVAGNATISNEHTDANALAASETYIASYRRGNVVVQLPSDITAGSIVHAKLVRNAFNFGTNSPGTENKYLRDNPPADSDAQKFQSFIVDHFNILVPSNAGKWIYQEPEPGKVSLSYADDIMRFAKAHDIHGRMHNLIWDTEQQPMWVRGLLKAAEAGDQQAKSITCAIALRITSSSTCSTKACTALVTGRCSALTASRIFFARLRNAPLLPTAASRFRRRN
jgi:Glycosyl hydrolase family 10